MIKDLNNICNQKVFEKIFNTYAKDLRRFLFFKTRDMDLAEDILQDSFIKLWDNCNNVNPEKAKSFLFTVAQNMFFNHKKHEKVVIEHQRRSVKSSNYETPEFLLVEKEFLVKIEEAISDLPEKQKEVFLLSRIEKKKYKEIAEMLGISVKAVEKRMHLALMKMKDKIGNV
tara:strand:+ start:18109 stop:18621 length:513 start_codon:yes stop_codon:yes gene_type:complete